MTRAQKQLARQGKQRHPEVTAYQASLLKSTYWGQERGQLVEQLTQRQRVQARRIMKQLRRRGPLDLKVVREVLKS